MRVIRVESHVDPGDALQAEWASFVSAARHHHPHQDTRFGPAEQAQGHQVVYVTGRGEDGRLCAVGLFSIKPLAPFPRVALHALCRDGPVCDDIDTLLSFAEACLRLPAFSRVGHLRLAPCWAGPEAQALHQALARQNWITDFPQARWSTGWVDLEPPAKALLATFSKSARREIRRAERAGVVVRPLAGPAEAELFLRSLNRLRQSRGLTPVPAMFFRAVFDSFYAPGRDGIILGAFHGEDFLAGLQIHRSRDLAHGVHFAVETQRLAALSNLRIAPVLWFQGMTWAQSMGCHALDLEGWSGDIGAGDAHFGIHKYKGEFSPVQTHRLAEHRKAANPVLGGVLAAVRRLRTALHGRADHGGVVG